MRLVEQFDGLADPDAPMSEQPAPNAHGHDRALVRDGIRRHQVRDDVVVVPGVERDAIDRAGFDNAANHVEGAVAVERRDLDGHHVVDRGEAAPERRRQHDAANGRLEIETDQRNFLGDRRGVGDDFIFAAALHRGEGKQAGVIAEFTCELRLLNRLRGAADEAGDHDRGTLRPFSRRLHRKLKDSPIEPNLADRELRGVDADRKPAGAGIEIITGECTLPPRIELALCIQCQRMRRYHHALAHQREHLRRPIGPTQSHRSLN